MICSFSTYDAIWSHCFPGKVLGWSGKATETLDSPDVDAFNKGKLTLSLSLSDLTIKHGAFPSDSTEVAELRWGLQGWSPRPYKFNIAMFHRLGLWGERIHVRTVGIPTFMIIQRITPFVSEIPMSTMLTAPFWRLQPDWFKCCFTNLI